MRAEPFALAHRRVGKECLTQKERGTVCPHPPTMLPSLSFAGEARWSSSERGAAPAPRPRSSTSPCFSGRQSPSSFSLRGGSLGSEAAHHHSSAAAPAGAQEEERARRGRTNAAPAAG